jgi:hypothetical protein
VLPGQRLCVVAQLLFLTLSRQLLIKIVGNIEIRTVAGEVEYEGVFRRRMPIGAQAQIDPAAVIVEVSQIDRIEKPIRAMGRSVKIQAKAALQPPA